MWVREFDRAQLTQDSELRQRLDFILSAARNHWRALSSIVLGVNLVLWGERPVGSKDTRGGLFGRDGHGPEGRQWWLWRRW